VKIWALAKAVDPAARKHELFLVSRAMDLREYSLPIAQPVLNIPNPIAAPLPYSTALGLYRHRKNQLHLLMPVVRPAGRTCRYESMCEALASPQIRATHCHLMRSSPLSRHLNKMTNFLINTIYAFEQNDEAHLLMHVV
jgi:hypothetical protein